MAEQHIFTTDVIRHALDVRKDDVCVRPDCGKRRDDPVHVTRYAEPRKKAI